MTQPGIEPMIVSRADLARRLTERYGQVTITDLSNWTRAADLHSVLRPTGDPSERTFTLYQVGILTRMARAIRRRGFSPVEAFRLATLTRSSYEQYFLFSELDLKRSEGPYSLGIIVNFSQEARYRASVSVHPSHRPSRYSVSG